MSNPNPEQVVDLASQKARFIELFLRFADKVAPQDDRETTPYLFRPSGINFWKVASNSGIVESNSGIVTPTAEGDSFGIGVQVNAYRTGFNQAGVFKIKSLGSNVHAAEVAVGRLNSVGGSPAKLLGATTVLHVTEFPPKVFVLQDDLGLAEAEPTTPAWEKATGIVKDLYEQKAAFMASFIG